MNYYFETIRSLASRETQVRFIAQPVDDLSLSPEDLLGTAMSFVADVQSDRRGIGLSELQRKSVEEFGHVLATHYPVVREGMPGLELIDSADWIRIRDAAILLLLDLAADADFE